MRDHADELFLRRGQRGCAIEGGFTALIQFIDHFTIGGQITVYFFGHGALLFGGGGDLSAKPLLSNT